MKPDGTSDAQDQGDSDASDFPLIPDNDELVRRSIYEGRGPLYTVERFMAHGIKAIIFISMFGLGAVVAIQVFARYVLAAPILGIMEIAPLLALWAYFGGMAYATRQQSHVVGGILTFVVHSVRVKLFVRMFISLVCILTTGVFLYFVWPTFMFNVSIGRASAYMDWPWALWGASMISGFVLMVLYFTLQLALEIRAFIHCLRVAPSVVAYDGRES